VWRRQLIALAAGKYSMKSVYIDESGYTGIDLLNKEQTFQGASALYISDSEAEDLIKEHFPKLQSPELKYKKLVKRKANWENLLGLQKDILENHVCINYVCDKRFLLILHFLDYAVEPFYYERDINIYEDGGNYSLGSLLYYVADTILNGQDFKDILSLFQYAINSKSDISISALIEKIKFTNWQELPEAFGPLALENSLCMEAIKNKNTSTDAAYIVLFSLISRLEAIIDHEYRIVHDRSKNLEQYDVVLNKMINHETEISFKQTSLTTLKFPLKLRSISQIDSKDSPGVQLTDVLIGGLIDATKAITGIKVNNYNKRIIELYKDDQLIHLLPNLNFEEQKGFRKGTQADELIGYFSKHFS
jgi:hypothetical protein